ncbi:SOCS3 [Branchiostoma lanceolatum]|uniref:SOCS3 protein n=1 Tax=Branchiostoma lanceolatum TaxID=7740 RepID=A0A8K0A277_BRALA|nr:SOCS3 [Branchiostoma lanceolatum]
MLEVSGWYWASVSRHEAAALLNGKEEGTFLVRDSADPGHLFSLSLKTARRVVNARIVYTEHGTFRLDSIEKSCNCPQFDCVVKLLDFYMTESSRSRDTGKHSWVQPCGTQFPLKVARPLKSKVCDLKHLCRRAIHAHTQKGQVDDLSLPEALKTYLKAYPFRH